MKTQSGSPWRRTAITLTVCLLAAMGMAAELQLIPNSTTKVDVPGSIKKINVSNPNVIDARPSDDGEALLVTGLQVGTGEIRITRLQGEDLVYRVAVNPDLKTMGDQIADLLKGVEGLRIKVVGDRVVLDGNLLTKSDYDRVKMVQEAYSGTILNLSKLDRAGLNTFVAEAIQRDIGIDTVSVRVAGETATLEGVVYDESDLKRVVEIARMRIPNVVNLVQLEEVMIETDVYFLQLDMSKSRDLGFNVLKTLGVEGTYSMSGGSAVDSVSSYSVGAGFSARVNALIGNGDAKVVAQPHITTKSGGEGRFHSGGEVYFEVSGVNAGSLEKIDYGILLTVRPTMRGKERIMTDVNIEVSVPSASPTGAFSLDKFETASLTMCKVGESVIISGLAQTLETRFKEKTPLLGHIPVLNLFFGESKKQRKERELVLVLTPRPSFPKRSVATPYSTERESLIEE